MELKQRIAEAKNTTKVFEEKTQKLAEELKVLKAQQQPAAVQPPNK